MRLFSPTNLKTQLTALAKSDNSTKPATKPAGANSTLCTQKFVTGKKRVHVWCAASGAPFSAPYLASSQPNYLGEAFDIHSRLQHHAASFTHSRHPASALYGRSWRDSAPAKNCRGLGAADALDLFRGTQDSSRPTSPTTPSSTRPDPCEPNASASLAYLR